VIHPAHDPGLAVGMLPDFYASRMPGTLADVEEAAARAEAAASVEAAAEELRPGDVGEAVTLATAVRWVRLRLAIVRATLATVRGLLPDRFEHCKVSVRSFRERRGVGSALMALRQGLRALPAPACRRPSD
jgi:hypothetical protein